MVGSAVCPARRAAPSIRTCPNGTDGAGTLRLAPLGLIPHPVPRLPRLFLTHTFYNGVACATGVMVAVMNSLVFSHQPVRALVFALNPSLM